MTSRERVLTALDHRETDRVPMDVGSCGPTAIHVTCYRDLLRLLGREEEVRLWDMVGQLAQPSEEVLELLGSDVRGIRVGGPAPGDSGPPNRMIDAWGTTWEKVESATCYAIVDYPLRHAGPADLDRYAWPDGSDPHRVLGLAERAQALAREGKYAVLGEVSGHILERAQMIRGFDTFLEDLGARPAFAEELLDRITDVEIAIAENFLGAVGEQLDVFAFKDDLGTQSGPLISTSMFRSVFKPRMRRYLDAVRRRTKARIWFHSCGSAYFAIPDLIDLGVEILNPVQVAAKHMDPVRLKREFGQNLCFWGAVDTQRVLPFGTPEEVAAEVRQRIAELGPGGGYVLASVHNIEADVPAINLWTMCEAARHPSPRGAEYQCTARLIVDISDRAHR
jgi:uroporphyrinogen decarboxylase